jgi:hypothetical protein
MNEALLLSRPAQGRDSLDRSRIGRLLVRTQDEGGKAVALPHRIDDREEARKGSCQGAAGRLEDRVELVPFLPLALRHPSLSTEGAMRKSIQELGLASHEDIDGIREELGSIEAFEAIGTEVFDEGVTCEEPCLHGQAVAAEAVLAVLHAPQGTAQVPGDG